MGELHEQLKAITKDEIAATIAEFTAGYLFEDPTLVNDYLEDRANEDAPILSASAQIRAEAKKSVSFDSEFYERELWGVEFGAELAIAMLWRIATRDTGPDLPA